MEVPYCADAEHYLANETQFRLGMLTTEQSHPITRDLSHVLRRDTLSGMVLLNRVDDDIPPVVERVAASGVLDAATHAIVQALTNGHRIFYSGCGATGRLSIQMESWWRDFWQSFPYGGHDGLEGRVVSIMAGGEYALITSVERFEDYPQFGREQITQRGVSRGDVLFAVTEGGETPHVIGTAHAAADAGARVFFVYNNPAEVLCEHIERSRGIIMRPGVTSINLTTGPQAIAGSTRMQAASIETLVLGRVLENALYQFLETRVPQQQLAALGFTPQNATSAAIARDAAALPGAVARTLPALARLADLEARTYRHGGNFNAPNDPHPDRGYALYVAGDRSGVVVLTDTTERSPTFSTPPFRRQDRSGHKASPVYLAIDAPDNASAWRSLFKRDPRGIDWDAATYERLLGAEFGMRDIPAIGYQDLLQFRLDGPGVLSLRPIGAGNLVIGTCLDDELASLERESFLTRTLASAREQGAATGLLTVAERAPQGSLGVDATVSLIIPRSPLRVAQSVGLKLALNTLSTSVMTLLGRVSGNYMTYVTPTNKKLIDRATRLIAGLSDVTYDDANRYLFSTIADTQADRATGLGVPPLVNIAVVRATAGVSTADAIAALRQHEGLLQMTLDALAIEGGHS